MDVSETDFHDSGTASESQGPSTIETPAVDARIGSIYLKWPVRQRRGVSAANVVTFPNLTAGSEIAADIRELLTTYDAEHQRGRRENAPTKVPITVTLAQCMNDYAIKIGVAARACHLQGYSSEFPYIYFAARDWSLDERNDWSKLSPWEKGQWSFALSENHWRRPETDVLKLVVLQTKDGSVPKQVKLFDTVCTNPDEAMKDFRGVFIIVAGARLFAVPCYHLFRTAGERLDFSPTTGPWNMTVSWRFSGCGSDWMKPLELKAATGDLGLLSRLWELTILEDWKGDPVYLTPWFHEKKSLLSRTSFSCNPNN